MNDQHTSLLNRVPLSHSFSSLFHTQSRTVMHLKNSIYIIAFERWREAAFNFHENVWKSVEPAAAILSFKTTASVHRTNVFTVNVIITQSLKYVTSSHTTVNLAGGCQMLIFQESMCLFEVYHLSSASQTSQSQFSLPFLRRIYRQKRWLSPLLSSLFFPLFLSAFRALPRMLAIEVMSLSLQMVFLDEWCLWLEQPDLARHGQALLFLYKSQGEMSQKIKNKRSQNWCLCTNTGYKNKGFFSPF